MKRPRTNILLVILWLFSFVFAFGLVRSIVGRMLKGDVVEERRKVLLNEERRNSELKQRLLEATSAAFIEKQAREKLGLVQPGDTIVLLQKADDQKGSPDTKVPFVSRWEKWWRLFF